MRHRVYGKKLNRDSNQRTGLFNSLVQSLFTHGTITTSKTKAFAIRGMVDKIINSAKNKNTRDLLQTYLTNKQLRQRLVEEIVPKLQNRISGYTSQVKTGSQHGDKTTMVRMSIIGNENLKPLEEKSRIKNKELRKAIEKPGKVSIKKVAKVTAKKTPAPSGTSSRRRSKKA